MIAFLCIYLYRRNLSKLKQIFFGKEICSWSVLKCVDNVRRDSYCSADNVADVSWILGDWKGRSQSCCSSQLHEICFLLGQSCEDELQMSWGTPRWILFMIHSLQRGGFWEPCTCFALKAKLESRRQEWGLYESVRLMCRANFLTVFWFSKIKLSEFWF